MERLSIWLAVIMVATAAAGTAYYIWLELDSKGELSAVGWSVIAVVWLIVLRRLLHFRRK